MESYIARQPIFSAKRELYSYELLYRDNRENFVPANMDGNMATRKVISNALFTFDIDSLTKGLTAFVNFTRQLLLEEIPMLLNPSKFVIEILEDVDLDLPLLHMLQKYKEAGFTLALDDYVGTHIPYNVLPLLDIIKVDFRSTTRQVQKQIAQDIKLQNVCLLAEKVENEDDFQSAVSLGYRLFQGYYFSKPIVLQKNSMSMATLTHARLAAEVSQPELNFKKVADIIYPDAQLTWLLMKKMRSGQFYRGHSISSINLALTRMGTNEVRRWCMLLLLQNALGKEMDELIKIALIRAVFCECLSANMTLELQTAAFSAGLFSVIASRDDTFYQTLNTFANGDIIRDALSGKNELGYSLNLSEAYEKGDWSLVNFLLKKFFPKLDSYDLSTIYMAAVNYADSSLSGSLPDDMPQNA